MLVLTLLLIGIMGISVSLGAVTIPLSKSWPILLHPILGDSFPVQWTVSEASIIRDLRLPRTLSGVLV